METVHVELPHEARHVGVLVVVRQQRGRELRLVPDTEGAAVARPADVVICTNIVCTNSIRVIC